MTSVLEMLTVSLSQRQGHQEETNCVRNIIFDQACLFSWKKELLLMFLHMETGFMHELSSLSGDEERCWVGLLRSWRT